MRADSYPLQVLLLTVSGGVHRHQADAVAHLVEETRVLKERLDGRALRLTDDQRRRLAAKAKVLGRKALESAATIVTPDTLMRWQRRLIAAKWMYETNRVGRPRLMKTIAALIVRMARANSTWGDCRIQGEFKEIGHRVLICDRDTKFTAQWREVAASRDLRVPGALPRRTCAPRNRQRFHRTCPFGGGRSRRS